MTERVSVLLADDSTTIRAMLSSLLNDVPEIDLIAVAENGEQAVELTLEHRPNVVIMDMQMPGLAGLDAARQILETWPEARIIMNTAYGDPGLKAEAEDAGAIGYITKDQRPAHLIRTVLDVAGDADGGDAVACTGETHA